MLKKINSAYIGMKNKVLIIKIKGTLFFDKNAFLNQVLYKFLPCFKKYFKLCKIRYDLPE